ncbi:DUF339-domain-containing protein [Whalleya microplaca]|nr:DUF339-domain-containing protein [Whalleya microplaca]
MASSIMSRSILRSAHRGIIASSPRFFSTTRSAFQTGTGPDFVAGNVPPMEPHKQRPQSSEVGVGELEGTDFHIEPVRRVGEDDKTMRARLLYQSRKRGILESDLLLSTFADKYLPSMTREQMAEYDRFLDENDWDIYYWATQETPSSFSPSAATSTTTGTSAPSKTPTTTPPTPSAQSTAQTTEALNTPDTSSPLYAGGAEALSAETSTPTSTTSTTGGSQRLGDFTEGKESKLESEAPPRGEDEQRRRPGEGEWAQTVGTFKPAYRPVPARWRDSAVLALLREHRRACARVGGGGMAFMPALR